MAPIGSAIAMLNVTIFEVLFVAFSYIDGSQESIFILIKCQIFLIRELSDNLVSVMEIRKISWSLKERRKNREFCKLHSFCCFCYWKNGKIL